MMLNCHFYVKLEKLRNNRFRIFFLLSPKAKKIGGGGNSIHTIIQTITENKMFVSILSYFYTISSSF